MTAYDLNGKVALVSGAAQGIGYETARQMHMRGASVVLTDLDADAVAAAAGRVGPRAHGIAADVTDAKAMERAVAETVERFGGLDVVVANAGIAPPGLTMLNTGAEDWERVLDVNLRGVWRTLKPALPQIAERGGQVVLLGSIYSYANGFMASPYAVSKAAVEALGRALRVELAPHGASATVVYFGWVDTKMVQGALEEKDSGKKMQDALPDFVMKRITPASAAATLVRAVEQRAPRAFAPGWWRYYAALRGLLNPLLDRRMERDPRAREAILSEQPGAGSGAG